MPPAFVLSQDQTLKFIPGQSLLSSLLDPNKGLQTFASMHEHQATLSRRPRIPSHLSTISNNTPPPVSRPQRGAAYRPPQHPRQHPNPSADRSQRLAPKGAQKAVKVIPSTHPV